MNLEMPIIDGWEATRRIKNDPQTRDIPMPFVEYEGVVAVAA
jgi:CheY-like chemotaxis protein